MTTRVDSECVLVVPTPRFHAVGLFQGFTAEVERYREALFDAAHTSYRPRPKWSRTPRSSN